MEEVEGEKNIKVRRGRKDERIKDESSGKEKEMKGAEE